MHKQPDIISAHSFIDMNYQAQSKKVCVLKIFLILDLFLTNVTLSFQCKQYLLVYQILINWFWKTLFSENKPNKPSEIVYRNYKYFNSQNFNDELKFVFQKKKLILVVNLIKLAIHFRRPLQDCVFLTPPFPSAGFHQNSLNPSPSGMSDVQT